MQSVNGPYVVQVDQPTCQLAICLSCRGRYTGIHLSRQWLLTVIQVKYILSPRWPAPIAPRGGQVRNWHVAQRDTEWTLDHGSQRSPLVEFEKMAANLQMNNFETYINYELWQHCVEWIWRRFAIFGVNERLCDNMDGKNIFIDSPNVTNREKVIYECMKCDLMYFRDESRVEDDVMMRITCSMVIGLGAVVASEGMRRVASEIIEDK